MNTSPAADGSRESLIPKETSLLHLVAVWAFVSILGGVLGGLTSSIVLHQTTSDPPVEEEEDTLPPPAAFRIYRAFDLCVQGPGMGLEYCILSDEMMFRRPISHGIDP